METCNCGKPALHKINFYNSKEDFKKNMPVETVISCTFCILENCIFAITNAQRRGDLKTLDAIVDIEVPSKFIKSVKKNKPIQERYRILKENLPSLLGQDERRVKIRDIPILNPCSSIEDYSISESEEVAPTIFRAYP